MMNKDKASNEFIENLTRKMFLGEYFSPACRGRDEATTKKLQIKKGVACELEMLCVKVSFVCESFGIFLSFLYVCMN